MALDVGLITALLIEYDCEHPKTLGEMTDRRSIYAQRLANMSVQNALPEKMTTLLGDGINSEYEVHHPFGKKHILVSPYDRETNELIVNYSMASYDGHIHIGFAHPIEPQGVRLVIVS